MFWYQTLLNLIAWIQSSSILCRKSWVLSGFSGVFPKEKLTGLVRIYSWENVDVDSYLGHLGFVKAVLINFFIMSMNVYNVIF